jgi:polyisoprenoid-binding protein YceI
MIRTVAFALVAALALVSARPAAAEAERYEIDPSHASVGFLVEHVGYARVLGLFTEVSGGFAFDEAAPALTDLRVVIKSASVFTGHAKRDEHLRGPDFLNAAAYPEMVFTGSRAEATGPRTGRIEGTLTLLGQSRPVTLDVTWNKSGRYPLGLGGVFPPYVTGISARGQFKRSDFGMNYAVSNGWVGDTVELIIELEAVRQ